ncbi:Uncharacterized protein DAT39_008510, partial [Clarias magur]
MNKSGQRLQCCSHSTKLVVKKKDKALLIPYSPCCNEDLIRLGKAKTNLNEEMSDKMSSILCSLALAHCPVLQELGCDDIALFELGPSVCSSGGTADFTREADVFWGQSLGKESIPIRHICTSSAQLYIWHFYFFLTYIQSNPTGGLKNCFCLSTTICLCQ